MANPELSEKKKEKLELKPLASEKTWTRAPTETQSEVPSPYLLDEAEWIRQIGY